MLNESFARTGSDSRKPRWLSVEMRSLIVEDEGCADICVEWLCVQ